MPMPNETRAWKPTEVGYDALKQRDAMPNELDYLSGGRTGHLPHTRRGGLITYGVISIVIGAMAGCMAAMMPIALMTMRMTPMRTPGATTKVAIAAPPPLATRMIVEGMLVYLVGSLFFIWLGIASCKCRRWVRPVILSLTWPVLIIGSLAMGMMAFLIPD